MYVLDQMNKNNIIQEEYVYIIKKINSKNIYNNLVLHINNRPANKFL